ncbi:MAG TPA: hypothetical protein ENI24_05510 [Methylophaga sp.]|nr:hypothetical protein [Methylophaga sp.]
MSKNSEDLVAELERAFSGGGNTKALRFLLNCLSGVPVVGGGFSATAGAWSEKEQNEFNKMLVAFSKITDERVTNIEKSLVDSRNHAHVLAGFITFNPNKSEFIDSSEISSLTDNGVSDFTINFTRPFNNYIFNYYGSSQVVINQVKETENGMRVVFEEPCPDKVTFVFYEPQPNNASQPTPKSGAAEF